MTTKIISAFCGTGKTRLCKINKNMIELECWKYAQGNFPDNYIQDIMNSIGEFEVVFISTNPLSVNKLVESGIKVIIVYPNINLKKEYIKRFKKRGSSEDFISTLNDKWDIWITEIEENKVYKHKIKLKRGQYISDILEQKYLNDHKE